MAETRRSEAPPSVDEPEENRESFSDSLQNLTSTVKDGFSRARQTLDSAQDFLANLTIIDSGVVKQPNKSDVPDGVTVSEKDGKTIHQHKDGSSLEFKDGKLTKINCIDGTSREITWDGDQIKSVKTNSGTFNRAKGRDGDYKDEWIPEGATTNSGWKGKVEVDPRTGDYTLIPTEGDKKDARLIYKADGTSENRFADGRREVIHANKDTVKYDKQGNIAEMSFADGSKRKFEWKENPSSKGDDDKYMLSSVHVTRQDGKQFFHARGTDGGWTVQRLENGQWAKAEAEKISFSVDNKTGEYSYKEDGVTTRMRSGKTGSESETSDGAKLGYDKEGYLTSATKDGKSREFKYDKGNLVEVKDSIQGNVWRKQTDGSFQSSDGKTRTGKPFVTPTGDFGFEDGGKKSVIKMDGTEFERIDNEKEKSSVEKRDGEVRISAGDGSSRLVKTGEKGEILEESVTRGGKTETWIRGDERDGGHVWKNKDTGAEEVRKEVRLSGKGELSISYPDGREYKARTDGSERMEKASEKWHAEYKQGRPSEIKFGDGTVRQFTYEGDSNSPKTITVNSTDGSKTEWVQSGKDQYKTAQAGKDDKPWNAKIEVGRDGTYRIDDRDEGRVTTRVPSGVETNEHRDGSRTEKFKGQLTRVTRDGQNLEIVRDGKGSVVELKDNTNNRLYRKDGAEFKPQALDPDKPYEKPDDISRRGEVKVDEKGNITFVASDGTRVKQDLGKPARELSASQYVAELAAESKHLSDDAKKRVQSNLDAISKRSDLSAKEISDSYEQIGKILEASDKSSPFTERQRHELAEQVAWHIANPERNEQGQNPNCQVTDIRTAIMMSSPSNFARMMADVATTGKFVSADGSTITPPAASLERPSKGEEAKFPPEDGARTWAGKIWDVTCANVYWQRQTRTPQGEQVAKGALKYEEGLPGKHKESGGKVNKYWESNGQTWYQQVNNKDGSLIAFPAMDARAMMDAYSQITGKDEKDRMIVHSRVNVDGPGVKVVDNKDSLHEALQKGPWPKIIQIHTSHPWVHGDSDNGTAGGSGGREGGEHVVVITGYDPKTKKVSIDNSWDPKNDRTCVDRRISLGELYESTKGKYQPAQAANTVTTTTGRTLYYSNGRYYYR